MCAQPCYWCNQNQCSNGIENWCVGNGLFDNLTTEDGKIEALFLQMACENLRNVLGGILQD